MSGRAVAVVCRVPVVGFWVLTALYALVASIPFTYHQVIEFKLLPWLDAFARFHPWLSIVALAAAAGSLVDDIRSGPQGLAVTFVVAHALATAGLIVSPVLAALGAGPQALVVAGLALVPLLWLALIDWVSAGPDCEWTGPTPEADGRLVGAAVLTGPVITVMAAVATAMRGGGLADSGAAVGASLAYHAVVFVGVAAALLAIRAVAALAARPALAEFVLIVAAAAAGMAHVVDRLVLRPLSVTGGTGVAIALGLSAALVATASGLALRLWPRERPVESGFELVARPWGASLPPAWALGGLIVVAALFQQVSAAAAMMDWNYLLQQLAAVAAWVLVLALLHGLMRVRVSRIVAAAALVAAGALALGGVRALYAFQPAVPPGEAQGGRDLPTRLDEYAGYDASFRFVRSQLRERRPATAAGGESYYALLQRHTNIPRGVTIDLPEVRLAPSPVAPPRRPHVFIIVIDSLRPDYLAPYNPAVTFTPALADFARDSVVFSQAFSRYGATGLAEPSIWVGGMIPHQQYPASFSRINALRGLMAAEGYAGLVSMDTILRVVVEPWAGLQELDAGRPNKDYRLCSTLEELGSKLRARPAAATDPVFVYTQPQDIHIATITREGKTVLDGGAYAGFYAPYASRVRRLDACFGGFVQTLKDTGLYDDSLIAFTSDHGDSLGEEGRWGHAYTVFPEIVRVPLIVRLPAAMRRLSVDAGALTFTTDLTPSLHYLLGRRPTLNQPLFGRPLFTERADERAAYQRESHVVASSYGPVYGWINDRGRALYILDAASYRDYAYTLSPGVAGTPMPVTADLRQLGGRQIASTIRDLAAFYRIPLDH